MDRRLAAALILSALVAAGMGAAYIARTQPQRGDKLTLVASFYPLAYMAEAIGGEKITVTTLIQPGIEPHSWQPSAGDLVACSDADIIVYNGAGLDNWLQDDILPSIEVDGKIIVDTTQNVTLWRNVEAEEIEEHGAYDPHTWVSPYEASQQAKTIYEALIQRDPANADYYTARWNTLNGKLEALDESYKTQLGNDTRTMIFVTHDAFGYIARRYGFQQQSIVGISADEQPSTQTLTDIIDLMQQTDTYTFYIEPGYSNAYVQTIQAELQSKTGKNIRILELHHMNGLQDDLDYLAQMEVNLENLRTGLGS
jgi:zinc transport system substrate-binding protein